MKRILKVMLVCMLVLMCATGVYAAEATSAENIASGTCGDNLTWVLDSEGTLTISGTGEMYDWTISTLSPWNSNRLEIKNVIINSGATSIGGYAFYKCTGLQNVSISESVTNIGERAFLSCGTLQEIIVSKENKYYSNDEFGVLFDKNKTELIHYPEGNARAYYEIPYGVIGIRDEAFYFCCNLKEINIPNTVTEIGEYAFYHCNALENIIIPDSVTTIKESAFYYCKSLSTVVVGKGVTNIIGDLVFADCSLERITVSEENAYYSSDDYGVLFDESKTILIQYPNSSTNEYYKIPDNVIEISRNAFHQCYNLKEINIPNTVTEIGEHAFSYCSALENIIVPDSVTTIGYGAFEYCDNLTNVYFRGNEQKWNAIEIGSDNTKLINATIHFSEVASGTCGDNLTWVLDSEGTLTISGTGEMYDWGDTTPPPFNEKKNNIRELIVGEGVTSIGNCAFAKCDSLTDVSIPEGVTNIGWGAFLNCNGLTNVSIPESVTSIDRWAFRDCSNLEEIIVDVNNKRFSSKNGILFDKGGIFLCCYPAGKRDVSYTIPDSVKFIRDGAFGGCANLVSVFIPESVTNITRYAFCKCEKLTNITIPNSVTTIGKHAFWGCNSLTNITIPESVTAIGDYAFFRCEKLDDITIPNGITVIGQYTFGSCNSLTNIAIPNSVTTIGNRAFVNCGNLTDVYYRGTEQKWNAINFGSDNINLTNSIIHYNSVISLENFGENSACIRNMLEENTKCDVTLLSGIDALKYEEMGFMVTVGGATTNYDINILYGALNILNPDGTRVNVLPTDFGEKAQYIFAITLPFEDTQRNETLIWRPYAIDFNGNRIYGKECKISPIFN